MLAAAGSRPTSYDTVGYSCRYSILERMVRGGGEGAREAQSLRTAHRVVWRWRSCLRGTDGLAKEEHLENSLRPYLVSSRHAGGVGARRVSGSRPIGPVWAIEPEAGDGRESSVLTVLQKLGLGVDRP